MTDPVVILPLDALDKIRNAQGTKGTIVLRHILADGFYVADRIEVGPQTTLPVDKGKRYKRFDMGDNLAEAQWLRTSEHDAAVNHYVLSKRPTKVIKWPDFRDLVPGVTDPGNMLGILIVHTPNLPDDLVETGIEEFGAWLVSREQVRPLNVAIEPPTLGVGQLAAEWPVERLQTHSVMVIGCGSIGSAAAEALAAYGVGKLTLVDPDRLLWHNLVRHTLGPEHVGQLKVEGLRDALTSDWPSTDVQPLPWDVIDDAHRLRPLMPDVDLVLCAADGIAPRRVANHLARRANKPAVLACVLDNGRIGELIRLRPSPRYGCLLCLRTDLALAGSMDAEADQELDYGTGRVHQPMTATPPDLRLVGTLAAKTAVATLLETHHGHHTQQLPGEHAIIGLHPAGDLASPYDLQRAGETRWRDIPPPRPDCPTCNAA